MNAEKINFEAFSCRNYDFKKQCSRVTPFTTVMTGPYLGHLHSIAAYSQWEEEANAGLRPWKAMNNRCTGLRVKRQSQQSHDASLCANESERSAEDEVEVARKQSGYWVTDILVIRLL